MAFTSFGENFALFDSTPVENLFIQEYMLRAPGNHVKVYLYGLMLCYHPSESMSLANMARDLDLTEDEVFSSYQYWERQGLVRRVADHPPRYVYNNLKQLQLMAGGEQESLYKYKDFNETMHNLFAKRRKLYQQDYQRVYEWIEVLGLPEEVVIMLLRHLIDTDSRGVRFSFDRAEEVARDWSERGVRTIEDAEQCAKFGKQQADDLSQVLRRLGQRRRPSEDEQELYHKWTHEWGFSLQAVLEACRETTKGTPSMAYLNGILSRQHQLGQHRPEEMVEGFRREKEGKAPMRALYDQLGMRSFTPTEDDMRWYAGYRDLGFSDEAMLLAARVAHHNGGKGRDAVEQRLTAWAGQGLFHSEQIEQYLAANKRDRELLLQIFEACGEQRQVTQEDRKRLAKWRDEWQLPMEVLLEAAGRASSARSKMPFLDAILSAWHQKGVRTVEEARKEAAQGAPPQSAANATEKRPVREVSQHRYAQREYSKEELDALVFDPFAGDAQEPEA